MEVKAVFFDIDGTLVNDRKSVLKSTKDAIKIVKEQGVLVGVATGRGPFFVKELMEDLDLDFAVTYNGQYIFSRDTKNLVATENRSKHTIFPEGLTLGTVH